MTKLSGELSRLVDANVLSPAQSQDVEAAARADLLEALASDRPAPMPRESSRSTVLEVLGYAGGALLLGAVIFLGVSFWDELERPARIGVALASFLVPAAGGAALVSWRTRPELGRVLLALACFTAGFAWTVIAEDEKLVGTAIVIVATSLAGVLLLRAGAFLIPGWSGAMMLVTALVLNVIDDGRTDDDQFQAIPVHLAIGFLVVAAIFTAAGFVMSKTLAWTLAGLSGGAASIGLQFDETRGDWLSLVVSTVIVAILFFGFVMIRRHALAAVGCLILLSVWPASLYRITDSELGAALGLVAAGGALILTVVLMSRRRRTRSATSDMQAI